MIQSRFWYIAILRYDGSNWRHRYRLLCTRCCNIQEDTGPTSLKRKGQLILCSTFFTPNLVEIIVPFYTMIQFDSYNGLYGHEKNSIYEKFSRVLNIWLFKINVGKEFTLLDSVRKVMKTFFIQAIYGDNKRETPGEARSVKSMKKKSWLRLCPDDETLDHYCERAN